MFKSLLNLKTGFPKCPLFKVKKFLSWFESLEQIDRKIFEEKMMCAYQELAQENLKISEDFKYVDSDPNVHDRAFRHPRR
jgi:hypothetical protein